MSAVESKRLGESEIRKLINEVKLREEIWKKNHRDHNNPKVLCAKWDELEGILKTSKSKLSNKWRTLNKQVQKAKKSGDPESFPFYQDMKFLLDDSTTGKENMPKNVNLQAAKKKVLHPIPKVNRKELLLGSDEKFFSSFLPWMQSIHPNDRPRLRLRLLALLYFYVYKDNDILKYLH